MFLNNKGRTIIEMITVVIILGIISAVAYPMIFMNERILNRQIKESATRNDVRGLENFLKDDLRNSKDVGIRLIDDNDSDLYSYTLIVADTGASEIIYKREKRADDSLYLVRQKDNQKIDFTDVKGLEIDKDTNNSRLIDVKITTLDDRGEELKHEFKVARWQWLMAKEESSQPGGVIDFIVNENVFVMGTKLEFGGIEVLGPGATILIGGDVGTGIIQNPHLRVSNIFIGGDLLLKGSESIGRDANSGEIRISKDVNMSGSSIMWGKNIYINGNVDLTGSARIIAENIYIFGNLDKSWASNLTGNLFVQGNMNIIGPTDYQLIVGNFTFPGIPSYGMPVLKPSSWFEDPNNGYSTSATLQSGKKFYSEGDVTYNLGNQSFSDVVIVSRTGDIVIKSGWKNLSGILFAPNGTVKIGIEKNGKIEESLYSFEGLIIAQGGLSFKNGGTFLTFKGIEDFTGPGKIFASEADYPFTNP